jgi:vancomycin resistance protein YoaR
LLKAIRGSVYGFRQYPCWILTISAFLCISFLSAWQYVWYRSEQAIIVRGVCVKDLDLGGKTPKQAYLLLKKHCDQLLKQPMFFVDKNFRVSFIPSENGFDFNYDLIVQEAFRFGHEGYFFQNMWQRWVAFHTYREVPMFIKVNQKILNSFFQLLEQHINIPEIPAVIELDRYGRLRQNPSQVGRKLCTDKLTNMIKTGLLEKKQQICLPVAEIQPEVTEKEISDWSLLQLMGVFTTQFDPTKVDRAHNISLAAQSLHNIIVKPGDTFSFNDTVGPRIYEAGYREAPIIIKNELVIGVGGGICQVSSTLYNVLLVAGFSKITRVNHSLPIGYVPMGRDATVVFGATDLTFVNTLSKPVMLATSFSTDGYLTVAVLGSGKSGNRVRLVTKIVEMVPYSNVVIQDPMLAKGERKVEGNGKNGYNVELYRVWENSDGQVERKELVNRSYYSPVPRLIKVGIGDKKE